MDLQNYKSKCDLIFQSRGMGFRLRKCAGPAAVCAVGSGTQVVTQFNLSLAKL